MSSYSNKDTPSRLTRRATHHATVRTGRVAKNTEAYRQIGRNVVEPGETAYYRDVVEPGETAYYRDVVEPGETVYYSTSAMHRALEAAAQSGSRNPSRPLVGVRVNHGRVVFGSATPAAPPPHEAPLPDTTPTTTKVTTEDRPVDSSVVLVGVLVNKGTVSFEF